MAALANAEQRNMRARETPEDRRRGHAGNRPVDVVNLLSDEDMPAAAGQDRQLRRTGQIRQPRFYVLYHAGSHLSHHEYQP
eukprot:15785570-Heterocapsa_arctica.AAC.1